MFVPVALVQVRFAKLEGVAPVTVRLEIVALVSEAFVAVRASMVPVAAYRKVEVELTVVRFVMVAFGTVRRPRRLRLVPVAFK